MKTLPSIFFFLIFTLFDCKILLANETDIYKKIDIFSEVLEKINKEYVEDINQGDAMDAAINGVLQSLDPYSSYMSPQMLREMQTETKGEFGGLGIEVGMEAGVVKVISPIDGSPAEEVGVKAGDYIVKIDGTQVQGKTLSEAVDLMRGPVGSEIEITVRRIGTRKALTFNIVRDIIEIKSVKSKVLENSIGYVRLTSFNDNSSDQLEDIVKDFKKNKNIDKYILDLRNNPGGLLDQSLILADSFLEKGEIVSIRGRDRDLDRSHKAEPGDIANGVPMVVLINSGSASASEIVASALQFHNRAILMGTRSFGKGSVQTILPMPVEGGLKLTTSLYYAPSGETIQARGVMPDIIISPSKEGKNRHENDLAGALPAIGSGDRRKNSLQVSENVCPPSGAKEDRGLGCALAFLQAGSAQNFFSLMEQRSPKI